MTLPEKLKLETSALHTQLETNTLLQKLTSDGISKGEYKIILEKFFGFFYPLEEKLTSFAAEITPFLPDFAERRKSDWLLRDLSEISDPVKQQEIKFCNDLPEVNNSADAFGCLYVLEGSTLGGRFISKSLNTSLNLTANTGASYFNGYADKTGSKWKTFREALQNFSEQNKSKNDLITFSANNTFLKLNNWLSQTDE